MKRFLFASGLLLLFTLAGTDARAQTGTARGKILDEQSQPLADVKIEIEFKGGITRKLSATTNKKGEFTQVGLQPGDYRFTANKDGYQAGYVETRVNLGDVTAIPDMKLRSLEAAKKAASESGAAGLAGPFKAAVELLQAGKLPEAETAFKELLAKNPSVPQIHYNLGQIYSRKGDLAAAEAAFLKAIEVDASFSDGYAALSNLYLANKQADRALDLLQKASADHADDARVQFQLGFVFFNTGKPEDAGAAFNKALQLDASLAEANFYLGTIAVGQNKTEEALAYLQKYLATNPPAGQNRQAAEGLVAYFKSKK
jgi:tetratricopeptide (TPR) repeat protein